MAKLLAGLAVAAIAFAICVIAASAATSCCRPRSRRSGDLGTDGRRTMAPMLEETLSATEWARVATSLAPWMAVPIALGFWRVLRSDVR